MRSTVVALIATGLFLAASTGAAFAQVEVRVAQLLDDPDRFDAPGLEITLEGELVGDYGHRSDGWAWTQLNDDSYARDPIVDGGPRTGSNIGVAVRFPVAWLDGLDPPGGYRLRGPIVRATGTWKYHDPGRGGESYLEVSSLEVVDPGRRIEEGPDWPVFVAGVVLVAVAGALWLRRPRRED